MPAIEITVTGNLARDPDLDYTATGTTRAVFTVASNERYRDNDGEWKDGPTSWVRCVAWRDLAEHLAETLVKGDRVIVTGALRQRDTRPRHGMASPAASAPYGQSPSQTAARR
jgi:single-strand DNA-binding protein